MKLRNFLQVGWLPVFCGIFFACARPAEKLDISFQGNANLEIGGPYVGLAFHHAAMIPQRISFFYPAANSIDHSRDYWTRDTSFTMQWMLYDAGVDSVLELGRDKEVPFDFTPYRIAFTDSHPNFTLTASYQFCQTNPACVQTISLENTGRLDQKFRFSYKLKDGLRTCHTYKIVDTCATEIDSATGTVYKHFADPDTKAATVFLANAGIKPTKITTHGPNEKPFTTLDYSLTLAPGEKQTIVLIIGSALENEARSVASYLLQNYTAEIRSYEQSIEKKIFKTNLTHTGDPDTDHSVAWAKAVMETNQHFLDGELVPMPCPAEYNFYFTHDVQVTDLAAVQFDLERVRRDLNYIIRHADENRIIPHAYYWKDGQYVTEYASSDNWNNFWFIQLTASYLRHSGDLQFVKELYPFASVCLKRALLTLEKDSLMWSNRPDWWDIGHNYGPNAYMTILAIKSLRDYIYISATLDSNQARLGEYAATADGMQQALSDKLWDSQMGYLVSYHNDGTLDTHYYIGPLLAVDFDLLSPEKSETLLKTAQDKLLDDQVGVYNAYPMDFDELIDYYKFAGNEAGAKFDYANGGVWSQGNAWYALALIKNGYKAEAAKFIENTMSLHGIWAGPNGQPAYYEVRNANRVDPTVYGHVDKPQFLWASAWYMYSLYNLFGVRENTWNISLEPYLSEGQESNQFHLFAGGNDILVHVSGAGPDIAAIDFDGEKAYSAVLPEHLKKIRQIQLKLGEPEYPCLVQVRSALESCKFDNQELALRLRALSGFQDQIVVKSPQAPNQVRLNSHNIMESVVVEPVDNYYRITVPFAFETELSDVRMTF
ncbi:MAG: hypothetical protein K9N34_10910 [Candidatus Marinimicrobia bacterium]|nr:hypothetical protein [Candidatus Neomarinimicrobiota bacterium]